MNRYEKMVSFGHDLMIYVLLKYFRIKSLDKDNYLYFCECENRRPLDDFVEYIISKSSKNVYNVTYNNNIYQYYISKNTVFFSKEGYNGIFMGEF